MIVATDAQKKTKTNVDPVLDTARIGALSVLPAPRWTWSADGDRLRIEVDLPSLVSSSNLQPTTTLPLLLFRFYFSNDTISLVLVSVFGIYAVFHISINNGVQKETRRLYSFNYGGPGAFLIPTTLGFRHTATCSQRKLRVLLVFSSPACSKHYNTQILSNHLDTKKIQTHTLHAYSTLDLESRRLLLHIPETHFLDINLALSDAEIGRINSFRIDDDDDGDGLGNNLNINSKSHRNNNNNNAGGGKEVLKTRGHNAGQALRLKRERDFDVEGARAEWKVKEGKLVVFV